MVQKKSWELTWAHDDDEVVMYWLQTPLMKADFGNTAAFFGMWHVGVGFKNIRTGVDTVAQFTADRFKSNLVSPTLDRAANRINWDTAATLRFDEGKLDTGYWVKRSRMATITGSQYNKYLKWVESLVTKRTNYFLFNLSPLGQQVKQPHLPGGPAAADFPPGGVSSADVAQEMVDQIKTIAGSTVFNKDCTSDTRTDAYLWVQPGTVPSKLDMTPGSDDFQKAFRYYETLDKAMSALVGRPSYPLKTMAEDAKRVIQEAGLSHAVYVDSNWDYWSYEPAERWGGYREAGTPHFPGGPL